MKIHRLLKSREKLSNFVQEGLKCELQGCQFLPYVKNVGIAEERLQHDGKSIVTVYPAMTFNRKPLLFKNYQPNSDDNFHPYARYKHADRFTHAFLKSRPKITEECTKSSEYYFEDGLRKVRPYYMVREYRITGLRKPMTALEYNCKIIPSGGYGNTKLKEKYIRLRFDSNCVYRNLKICKHDDMVRNGDVMAEIAHRHEKAVIDEKIQIIYEDNEFIVINKPSTLPVYPIGQYRMNSAVYILTKEFGFKNVRNVHRIDAGTSGVCIFAKDGHAPKIHKRLEDTDQVQKEYVARVEGQFPRESVDIDYPLTTNHLSNNATFKEKHPKESLTTVQFLDYDSETDTSLVKCLPKTGRTHQIRRHLAMFGHPIINDESYNEKYTRNRFDYDPDLISKAIGSLCERQFKDISSSIDPDLPNMDWKESLTRNVGYSHPTCFKCELGEDYNRYVSKMVTVPLCLHSVKYQLQELTLEAPWPKWATDIDYLKQIKRE